MKLLVITVLCILTGANAKSTRIINGENANAVIPFYALVELHRLPGLQGESYFGGGSLITQQAVLTVAQNVRNFQSWRCGLGALQVQQLQWFTVLQVVEHPLFNPATLAHNLAILRLVTVVPITSNTLAITRMPAGSTFPQAGNTGTVVGFGFGATLERPAILQQALLTTLSNEECGTAYPHLVANNQLVNHFCAHNMSIGSNICAGDQGGPVYNEQIGLLMGVQTFNRVADCSSPDAQPAAFLRVSEYDEFINNNLS